MKVEKICYEQLYPTGTFANQRYRVEISIEENVDYGWVNEKIVMQNEAAKKAFDYAKDIVEKTFIALNPQINWNNAYNGNIQDAIKTDSSALFQQVEKPTRDTVDNIIEDINSCKDEVILQTYKFIAKKDPRIQEAFDKKLKQFMQ